MSCRINEIIFAILKVLPAPTRLHNVLGVTVVYKRWKAGHIRGMRERGLLCTTEQLAAVLKPTWGALGMLASPWLRLAFLKSLNPLTPILPPPHKVK